MNAPAYLNVDHLSTESFDSSVYLLFSEPTSLVIPLSSDTNLQITFKSLTDYLTIELQLKTSLGTTYDKPVSSLGSTELTDLLKYRQLIRDLAQAATLPLMLKGAEYHPGSGFRPRVRPLRYIG